ncbi:MAG TPA: hypothetical protein VG457_05395, partial [Planctomycetota bacterium]|nr:hypothetical protein [Planctomycetota bacterium]
MPSLLRCLAILACCAPGLRAQEAQTDPSKVGVVCHVKVVSDKVPDMTNLETWKKAFIQEGMTDEQKALAVWRTVRSFQHQEAP